MMQDLPGFAEELPRRARDLPVLIVCRTSNPAYQEEFDVDQKRVEAALDWLIANTNNPLYRDLKEDLTDSSAEDGEEER